MEDEGSREQTDEILVMGRGVLPDGSPAAGARVCVYGSPTRLDDVVTRADERGRFAVSAAAWRRHVSFHDGDARNVREWSDFSRGLYLCSDNHVSRHVKVDPAEAGTSLGDVELVLGCRLTVECVDADGRPSPGVHCQVASRSPTDTSGQWRSEVIQRRVADQDGVASGFVMPADAESLTVSASAPSSPAALEVSTIAWNRAAGAHERVRVYFPRMRRVTGRLVDPHGRPFVFHRVDRRPGFGAAFTGEDGRFKLDVLADEHCVLRVRPTRHPDVTASKEGRSLAAFASQLAELSPGGSPVDLGDCVLGRVSLLAIQAEARDGDSWPDRVRVFGSGPTANGIELNLRWDAHRGSCRGLLVHAGNHVVHARLRVAGPGCGASGCDARGVPFVIRAPVDIQSDTDLILPRPGPHTIRLDFRCADDPDSLVELRLADVRVDDDRHSVVPTDIRCCALLHAGPDPHDLRIAVSGYDTVFLSGVEKSPDGIVDVDVWLHRR